MADQIKYAFLLLLFAQKGTWSSQTLDAGVTGAVAQALFVIQKRCKHWFNKDPWWMYKACRRGKWRPRSGAASAGCGRMKAEYAHMKDICATVTGNIYLLFAQFTVRTSEFPVSHCFPTWWTKYFSAFSILQAVKIIFFIHKLWSDFNMSTGNQPLRRLKSDDDLWGSLKRWVKWFQVGGLSRSPMNERKSPMKTDSDPIRLTISAASTSALHCDGKPVSKQKAAEARAKVELSCSSCQVSLTLGCTIFLEGGSIWLNPWNSSRTHLHACGCVAIRSYTQVAEKAASIRSPLPLHICACV